MSNGANSIHKQLRSELEDYIKAQYFGRSPLLLSAVGVRRAPSCPIGRNRSFCSFPRQG